MGLSGGQVLVVGGNTYSQDNYTQVEMFSLSKMSWQKGPEVAVDTTSPYLARGHNGKVILAGVGHNATQGFSYNTENGTWTPEHSLRLGRKGGMFFSVEEKHLVCHGGD